MKCSSSRAQWAGVKAAPESWSWLKWFFIPSEHFHAEGQHGLLFLLVLDFCSLRDDAVHLSPCRSARCICRCAASLCPLLKPADPAYRQWISDSGGCKWPPSPPTGVGISAFPMDSICFCFFFYKSWNSRDIRRSPAELTAVDKPVYKSYQDVSEIKQQQWYF